MNPIIEQLKQHRSIRKFTDQPLPEGLLETLIEAGQAASSGNNIQAYSVIRVANPENRAKLRLLAGDQAYIEEAAEFLVFCADMKRNTEATARTTGIDPVMGMTEQLLVSTVDVALMAQNVAIAAESVGLGLVYIGAVRNKPAEISALLQLPKHVYPVFGMCLGYPAQDPEVKPRLPVASILKQDVYSDADDETQVAAYDQTIREYYQSRTGGNKDSVWSEEMKGMFGQKLRPHMREFLTQQGFELK